jgi:RNA polymerase sigma-70 factor (ECF subfamily)
VTDASEPVALGLARGEALAEREVRGWVRRFLAASALALPGDVRADLEQEVMVELWQAVRRPDFDATRELGGFVRVLCARRAIDWWRSMRRREADATPEALADDSPGPLDELLSQERQALARRVFATLSTRCRELLRQQVVEKLSYREIALRSGRSEGALRVQLHRCIERARLRLRESAVAAR